MLSVPMLPAEKRGRNRDLVRSEGVRMKVAGIILAGLGGLMFLASIHLALTKYNLSSTHDLSKFAGGAGSSLIILVIGVIMVGRSRKPPVS